ncbi:hypothetical protein CXF85_07695 [Colwellia sp. 75C3]|uniref:SMI1/KNR4 family protein n=1 Tax=Colwellia sp. 75C3 TaxID=888425 RepID=UPI000C33455B|nr:SMI1/KNR4 family protein [Colwellia sp. 75C3]PKG85451.1 hypothetical protein CXF85_07695 [Colwellia sp. 75C3]
MNKVKEYIEAKKHDFLMKTGVSKSEVNAAQDKLGFIFDADYTYYLANYGLLSYESMETFGLGVPMTSYRNIVTATLNVMKEYKSFPTNAVVIEDIGEDNYVIIVMDKGVFQFSPNSLDLISDNLEDYLLLRFSEVI